MKFRRKSAPSDAPLEEGVDPSVEEVPARGPFDVDDAPDDGVQRVDLGSLILTPESGRELRLQVDERTQEVQAVILTGPDGALERVGVHELAIGDRVHVNEGGVVPADGVLESSHCRVDQALLTGESAMVRRSRGERLIAGSVVEDGGDEGAEAGVLG